MPDSRYSHKQNSKEQTSASAVTLSAVAGTVDTSHQSPPRPWRGPASKYRIPYLGSHQNGVWTTADASKPTRSISHLSYIGRMYPLAMPHSTAMRHAPLTVSKYSLSAPHTPQGSAQETSGPQLYDALCPRECTGGPNTGHVPVRYTPHHLCPSPHRHQPLTRHIAVRHIAVRAPQT